MLKITQENLSTFKGNAKSFITTTPIIQKKLKIGESDDKYEIEADRMADQVVQMKPIGIDKLKPTNNVIQRKCASCDEEKHIQKKSLIDQITPLIQKKATNQGGETQVSKAITNNIKQSKGGGNSLKGEVKHHMESGFGVDFSDVRIHTDSNANKLSEKLNAKAFTVGNDIFFNKRKYDPNSNSGKHLLAHELTHTIQQSGQINLKIQREMIKDRDGALKYPTNAEAQSRLNKMIRIVPNPNREGEFLIEWRWNPTNPAKDLWSIGTVSRSKKAAEEKLNQLMRVEGKGSEWYVIKDTSLMPDNNENKGAKAIKSKPSKTAKSKGETEQKTSKHVCLTFDDGPQNGTKDVLDVLADFKIKGTFFLTGDNFDSSTQLPTQTKLVKRMLEEKHILGNHTWNHNPMQLSDYPKVYGSLIDKDSKNDKKSEIDRFNENFNKNTRHFVKTLKGTGFEGFDVSRFPGSGRQYGELVKRVNKMGMRHVGWDYEFARNNIFKHVKNHNWQGINNAASTSKGLPNKGYVILFHDRHWFGKENKATLKSIIQKLKDEGFTFGIINKDGSCKNI